VKKLLRTANGLFAFLLCAIAAIYLLQTLSHIVDHGFRQPFQDQYGTYPVYLEHAFPRNVIESENGHRPIIPATVRVAEINFFHSNQILQLTIGTLFLLGGFFFLLRNVFKGQDLRPLHKAQIILLCTLAFFWMGSARMLMHGNESMHVHGVIFGVVAALGWMYAEGSQPTSIGMVKIIGAATFATFCFGNGLVLFPALCIMAVMRRWPWRYLMALVVSTILMIIIYVKILPGADQIGAIPWSKLPDGFRLGLSWLGNSIYHGWLVAGDWDSPRIAFFGSQTPFAGWVGESARAFVAGLPLGQFAMQITLLASLCSLPFAAWIVLHHLGSPLKTPLQFFAVALMIFAAGTGAMISLFRVNYFLAFPTQVIVERYVPWSNVWWLSLALYALSTESFAKQKKKQWLGAALTFFLAWGLSFTQVTNGTWARLVSRSLEYNAIALRLGIEDQTMLGIQGIGTLQRTTATVNLLRQNHLAMFAKPLPFTLGSVAPNAVGAGFTTRFDPSEWANTLPGATRGIHFSGSLPNTALTKQIDTMIVVNQNGRMVGLAKRTWIGDRLGAHWDIGLERKIGIDGYVVVTNPTDNFSLRVQLRDGMWIDGGEIPFPGEKID
jgi:hypothetical protein